MPRGVAKASRRAHRWRPPVQHPRRSVLVRQAVASLVILLAALPLLSGEWPLSQRLRQEVRLLVHERHDLREVMARLGEAPVLQHPLLEGWRRALVGPPRQAPINPRLLLPTEGVIASGYGWNTDAQGPDARFHPGIDIAAPAGAPVYAAEQGRVLRVWRDAAFGLAVELDHGEGLLTRYGRLQVVMVAPGTVVSRGQQIGTVVRSTASNLHFQVELDGRLVDPAEWLGMGSAGP